jgi:hypothetical protein
VRGQFTSPITLPLDLDEKIAVRGPLLEIEDGIHKATIVCVLVQGDRDPVWVEGRGKWKDGETEWTGWVGRKGRTISGAHADTPLQADDKHARGVAMAIAVKDATEENGKFVPPSIVTVTWCVDVALVNAGASQVGT